MSLLTTRRSRITKTPHDRARPELPDQHALLSRYRICRRKFVPLMVHSNIPPDSEDREYRIAVCRMDALGSVIRVTGAASYDGTYRVLDTGALVRRRHADLYIPDCPAARRFGRRSVQVEVIRTRQ